MSITVFARLNAAACDRRLSHAHFRVLYAITQRKTTGLKSQPSIANYVGIDRSRVKGLIDDLVACGYLTVKEGRGRGNANEYSFPEKGVCIPPLDGEERGHMDPILQSRKGGEIDQRKGGEIDPEKGVKSTPILRKTLKKKKTTSSASARARDDGWRCRAKLSEVEQTLRGDMLEREARKTASLTAAERKERDQEIFYMIISPWREKNGPLSAGEFKEARKIVRHLRTSGAAYVGEILIQNRIPMPDPLPDILDWLRSFDRDRGANGHDARPGNTSTHTARGANGPVTQQKGDPNEIS